MLTDRVEESGLVEEVNRVSELVAFAVHEVGSESLSTVKDEHYVRESLTRDRV